MTAATRSPETSPSMPIVLARAAAGEWIRLTSLRSTWWALAGATALMLLIGVTLAHEFAEEGAPVWLATEFAIATAQFVLLLVVVLAVTADYATGAIRSSLQWVPDRGVLLAARTLVPVAAMTLAAVAVSALTNLVAWALVSDVAVVATDVWSSLGSIALLLAVGGLLSAGIAVITRSTAGALTTAFLLLLVLPLMLSSIDVGWMRIAAELLPGHATLSLLTVTRMDFALPDVTGLQIGGILAAWVVAVTAAGAWSLHRRDAQ